MDSIIWSGLWIDSEDSSDWCWDWDLTFSRETLGCSSMDSSDWSLCSDDLCDCWDLDFSELISTGCSSSDDWSDSTWGFLSWEWISGSNLLRSSIMGFFLSSDSSLGYSSSDTSSLLTWSLSLIGSREVKRVSLISL